SAAISMGQPWLAESISRPMIERASTLWPSRLTVTSDSKLEASLTNLAEARACRPRALQISTVRRTTPMRLFFPGQHVGRHRNVLAPGLLGVGHAGLEALALAHAGQLDEHRQVEPGDDLGAGLLHHRDGQVRGRAAEHVGQQDDA